MSDKSGDKDGQQLSRPLTDAAEKGIGPLGLVETSRQLERDVETLKKMLKLAYEGPAPVSSTTPNE